MQPKAQAPGTIRKIEPSSEGGRQNKILGDAVLRRCLCEPAWYEESHPFVWHLYYNRAVEPLSTVTTAWSIAKTAGEISKKLYELGKSLKDRDTRQQVDEIVDRLRGLKQSASELEDENRELRERLRFDSEEYQFHTPFWYHKTNQPSQPLCPKCFANKVAAPMGEPGQSCSEGTVGASFASTASRSSPEDFTLPKITPANHKPEALFLVLFVRSATYRSGRTFHPLLETDVQWPTPCESNKTAPAFMEVRAPTGNVFVVWEVLRIRKSKEGDQQRMPYSLQDLGSSCSITLPLPEPLCLLQLFSLFTSTLTRHNSSNRVSASSSAGRWRRTQG